jgi:hypothetical protein
MFAGDRFGGRIAALVGPIFLPARFFSWPDGTLFEPVIFPPYWITIVHSRSVCFVSVLLGKFAAGISDGEGVVD